mmetsp:Transcript_38903/g.84880  ORF Transcript_38903/g.84880 Transcript_38903/m.84880 type:complete len:310 (-) Transcript_38903:1820-2749(-)
MEAALLTVVGVAIQLHYCVQGHRYIERFAAVQALPICNQHAQDSLVADDQQRFPHTLHLQHDSVEPVDDIQVGFSSWVPIRQLVASSAGKLIRVLGLDLLVSHSVTLSGVDLVEILPLPWSHLDPLQILPIVSPSCHCARNVPGGLLRPPQSTGPQPGWHRPARGISADFVGGEVLQLHSVGFSSLRETRIPPNLPKPVVLRLPVPRQVKHMPARVCVQHVGYHVAEQISVDVRKRELMKIVDLDPGCPVVQRVVHVEGFVRVAHHTLDAAQVVNNSVVGDIGAARSQLLHSAGQLEEQVGLSEDRFQK